ncbi:MAG: 4-amino-4-deoxychorismate lyase [Kangiellaceae bacterium]|jgi:4-amino-4-deoxychorismate lyase
MNIVITSYLPESVHSIFTLNAEHDLQSALKNIVEFYVAPQQRLFSKQCIKDRALNYGDGCFTTMYGESDAIFLFNEHFQRLARDCQKLSINVCLDTVKQWLLIGLGSMITKCHRAYAVKIIISRGVGGRGYELPEDANTSVIMSIFPSQPVDSKIAQSDNYHFSVKQANMSLSTQPLLAGIKHLNRLEQVLAKRELQQYECDDLILCDQAGILIEATAANIFYKKDGVWFTPELLNCGVSGVMREAILTFFKNEGLAYKVVPALFCELINADSIFLCNAIKFLTPVSTLSVASNIYSFDVLQASALNGNVYEWISMQKSERLSLGGGI